MRLIEISMAAKWIKLINWMRVAVTNELPEGPEHEEALPAREDDDIPKLDLFKNELKKNFPDNHVNVERFLLEALKFCETNTKLSSLVSPVIRGLIEDEVDEEEDQGASVAVDREDRQRRRHVRAKGNTIPGFRLGQSKSTDAYQNVFVSHLGSSESEIDDLSPQCSLSIESESREDTRSHEKRKILRKVLDIQEFLAGTSEYPNVININNDENEAGYEPDLSSATEPSSTSYLPMTSSDTQQSGDENRDLLDDEGELPYDVL